MEIYSPTNHLDPERIDTMLLASRRRAREWWEPLSHKYELMYRNHIWQAVGGAAGAEQDQSADNISVNLVYPNIRTMFAALSFRDPAAKFSAPYTWATRTDEHGSVRRINLERNARHLDAASAYVTKRNRLRRQIKPATFNALLMGLGVGLTGYSSEFQEDPLFDPGLSESDAEAKVRKENEMMIGNMQAPVAIDDDHEYERDQHLLALADDAMFPEGSDAARYLSAHIREHDEMSRRGLGKRVVRNEYKDYVVENMPYLMNLHPRLARFDASAVVAEDGAWMGHEFWRSTEEARADKRWINRDGIEATSCVDVTFGGADPGRGRVYAVGAEALKGGMGLSLFVKIYDKRTGTTYIYDPGQRKFVTPVTAWPVKMRDFPYNLLRFNPLSNHPYPVPDMVYVEKQILEKCRNRTAMLRAVDRQGNFVRIDPRMEASEKAKIKRGQAHLGIEAAAGQVDVFQLAGMSRDWLQYDGTIDQDIATIMGIPGYANSVPTDPNQTATLTSVIDRQFNSRVKERMETVRDFLEDIMRKQSYVIQQRFDQSIMLRVTGEIAEVPYRPDLVEGEFETDIDATSLAPTDKVTERQNLGALIEFLEKRMQLIEQMGEKLRLLDLIKRYVRTFDMDPAEFFEKIETSPPAATATEAETIETETAEEAPAPEGGAELADLLRRANAAIAGVGVGEEAEAE